MNNCSAASDPTGHDSLMTTIAAVRGALPEHRYPQAAISEMFASLLADPSRAALMHRLHASAGVQARHLVLPLDDYRELTDFGTANDAFIEHAVALGTESI